jgi:hypothetical protein
LGIYTGSIETRFTALENTTSSLNTFSGSTLIRLTNLESKSASVDTSITNINVYTQSVDSKFTTLQTYTGSVNSDLASIHQTTASLNTATASLNTWTSSTFTAYSNSVEIRLDDLEYTASISVGAGLSAEFTKINEFTASAKISIANLEAATGSYETNGRGIVSGSSQIVPLLPTGVISGSIQILGGSGIVSGAAQVTPLLPTGVISGSSQILGGSTIHSSSIGDYQFNSIGIGMAASTIQGRIDASNDIVAFSTSDRNFKENIIPITDALLKLENISGNTYDWKNEFEYIHGFKGNDVGVIAQEIQKVLPEAVRERENGYLGVNYEKIIPLLIESIKELSAKIKELENK